MNGVQSGGARSAELALRAGLLAAAMVFNSACVGASVEPAVEKVSLVEAWKMKMARKDAGHVVITYRPLLSSALIYSGADFESDGKTLNVRLLRCLGPGPCQAMAPSVIQRGQGEADRYEIVVPYRGERVVVRGDGNVHDELNFSE